MVNSQEYLKYDHEVEQYNFTRAGEASSSIKSRLKKLGLDAHLIRRIAVASYEAEINIIIHSYGGILTLYIYQDKIIVVAKDKGPGIEDIQLAMKEGYSTASDTAREYGFGAGMGLANIKRYCDHLQIESSKNGSTTITMQFKITDSEVDKNDN